jgi:NAD(P)-dependent dehydrogenase (short-subunit alcohol dehydrogenase family)
MTQQDDTGARPVALVTGGSRGIGAAIARRLGREGWDVVVGFRADADAADEVVSAIVRDGGSAVAAQVDVVDEASLDRFAAAGAARGAVRGVVVNAGAVRAVGALVDNALDDIRADLDVNLLGAIATARAAIPVLGSGSSIVLISSAAATVGGPGRYVHYAAAKAGVDALAIGLSKELAPRGIRVNAVAPGTTWTDFHLEPDRAAQVAPTVPLGRSAQPDEIAGAVAWLLSDDAGYATGAILRVAGGL